MANDISKIKLPGSTTEYTLKDSSAVANITRSGTTFTATKRDGTTFTFTQQDNNTTYTLSVGTGDDANKIVLTPSSGTANKITVPYATSAGSATSASKLGSSNVGSATQPIYLSAGTATACTYTLGKSVPSNAVFTDTTYTIGTNGNTITLTPSSGTAQSITAPYATSAGSATSASKLGSATVGSATNPIYLNGGTATACTYTLSKSVPSDAVFTDKNVSISSVDGGHDFYLTLSNTLNPSSPSYIYTNNGLKYYPTNGTATTNGYAALYLGNSTPSGTAGNQTGQIVLYSDGAGAATLKAATTNTTPATPCYLPTTGGTLTVMSGTAAGTNVVLSGEVDGLLVKSSYTIGKSVPSNAKFTDTTYGISNSGESITLTAGGTGTSVSLSTLINGLSVGTSTPNDNDYYISQYVGGGTTTTSYHRRPMSALYTYIKDKLQAGNLAVTDILGIQQISGTSGGISLYGGTGNVDNYGIAFRTTANKGKHGYVQSDWATYFTMNDNATRGWIFRRNGPGNVASISGEGHLVLNGSLTVGGNTANTSGARIVYNSTNQAIDFVFVA